MEYYLVVIKYDIMRFIVKWLELEVSDCETGNPDPKRQT